MGLDREVGKDILEIKEEVYKRTVLVALDLDLKNEDKSRHIRLYNR